MLTGIQKWSSTQLPIQAQRYTLVFRYTRSSIRLRINKQGIFATQEYYPVALKELPAEEASNVKVTAYRHFKFGDCKNPCFGEVTDSKINSFGFVYEDTRLLGLQGLSAGKRGLRMRMDYSLTTNNMGQEEDGLFLIKLIQPCQIRDTQRTTSGRFVYSFSVSSLPWLLLYFGCWTVLETPSRHHYPNSTNLYSFGKLNSVLPLGFFPNTTRLETATCAMIAMFYSGKRQHSFLRNGPINSK